MTHKQTVEALRLSLLMGATPEERHDVYPRRKPTVKPLVPLSPPTLPGHQFMFPQVQENRRLNGGLL